MGKLSDWVELFTVIFHEVQLMQGQIFSGCAAVIPRARHGRIFLRTHAPAR